MRFDPLTMDLPPARIVSLALAVRGHFNSQQSSVSKKTGFDASVVESRTGTPPLLLVTIH